MDRTTGFRRSDQFFISLANPHNVKRVTRQRVSHGLVEAITLVYPLVYFLMFTPRDLKLSTRFTVVPLMWASFPPEVHDELLGLGRLLVSHHSASHRLNTLFDEADH